MPDRRETEPDRSSGWQGLQGEIIHSWLMLRFGLNDARDKDIWLFCIGAAMELERLAVAVLWIEDGRPRPFFAYEDKMTLGQAHREIEKRDLLDPAVRDILKAVAELRNSVAHRHAVVVTAPSPIEGKPVGEYKGRHVFIYPEALDELIQNANGAQRLMYIWLAQRAPDLAADARRGGAHPTSP